MLEKLVIGCISASVVVVGPALAQSPSTKTKDQAAQNQTPQDLPERIRQKLQQQGFSAIKIVPGSLLVSAKDKDGDPVNMVIGPHSMTMFTVISADGTSAEKETKGTTSGQR